MSERLATSAGCAGMRTVTRLNHFEGKLDGTTKKRSMWTGGATLNNQQMLARGVTDTRPITMAGKTATQGGRPGANLMTPSNLLVVFGL